MADVYSFGIWNFIRSQLNLLVSKVDYFFIGKNLPVHDLGIYEKSFELKVKILLAQDNNSFARYCHETFSKNFEEFYGREYQKSFEEIANSTMA